MKKLFIIPLIFIMMSCYSTKSPAVNLGMTTHDFEQATKYREIIYIDQGMIVYRVTYGYNADRHKLYYFIDHKLVKVNEGSTLLRRYQIDYTLY